MSDTFNIVRAALLTPYSIDYAQISSLLHILASPNIDNYDLYFQSAQHENWILEDGIVKKANFSIGQGVGVRAVSGSQTGYAYSDVIEFGALKKAAKAARSIAMAAATGSVPILNAAQTKIFPLYGAENPLISFKDADKICLLQNVYAEILRQSRRVAHAVVSLSAIYELILIANETGQLITDIRPLTRLNVSVILEDKGRREAGNSGGGGRFGYEKFYLSDWALKHAREAVRIAEVNLAAVAAPAGAMPVVLGAGWSGILLHEAVGHGLEADFNRKGSSIFSDKMGAVVAAKCCTIIDQGNYPGERRGSLHVDDEGTPTQQTILVENGILKNYMHDKLNARLMQVKSTGNGRRESYASIPIPRMTNTYMCAGEYAPAEIIASVKKGIYAVNFSGGQVDITSGEFVFNTSEAYLIENGKITTPVKNASLIGNGSEVLHKISMVGSDLALDDGVGTCGKDGQSVPVGVGQPTVKVSTLTVGGTCT